MTAILGINAFHGDSAAALVIDGELVAAVEEERFLRIKHWAGFPAESIRFCLESAGIDPGQIGHVAVSTQPRANFWKKVWLSCKHRLSLRSIFDRLQRRRRSAGIQQLLAESFDLNPALLKSQFHQIEHHDAHIGHAFLTSPFDSAAILSIDGMGDFTSTVLASGEGAKIRRLASTRYPHSLGYLYNALTIYLGFPNYGDEYKVMGLAPYGDPEYRKEFRDLITVNNGDLKLGLEYFVHLKNGISMNWDGGTPVVEAFHSPLLEKRFGPAFKPGDEVDERRRNLASSLQAITEDVILELCLDLAKRTGRANVAIAGGCAMNSVAMGKISSETPFQQCFVPAGAADNGTAIGAAFHVWNRILGNPRRDAKNHAYLGPEFSEIEIRRAIQDSGLEAKPLDENVLVNQITQLLTGGGVAGWFQGRMEFGARALGARSLLADPRRSDIRDLINAKIKFREMFRPFAPSILEEHVAEWFEHPQPSPFMEKVLPIRQEKRGLIPAVCHVDGTGRLQTVSRRTNPRYWRLIESFREATGVPMILNTSLNENEPIVHTPAQAIACFKRTKMDALAIGDFLILRR